MPYSDVSQLPSYVKKYDLKIRKQFMHVFNTVYKSTNGNEARAFKAAHSILKKRFDKKDSMVNNTRDDYFNRLVDEWLGVLNG